MSRSRLRGVIRALGERSEGICRTEGVVATGSVGGQVGPYVEGVGLGCGGSSDIEQLSEGKFIGLVGSDGSPDGVCDSLHHRVTPLELVGDGNIALCAGTVVVDTYTHGIVLHIDAASQRSKNLLDSHVVRYTRSHSDSHFGEVAWAAFSGLAVEVVDRGVEILRGIGPKCRGVVLGRSVRRLQIVSGREEYDGAG